MGFSSVKLRDVPTSKDKSFAKRKKYLTKCTFYVILIVEAENDKVFYFQQFGKN